MIDVRGPKDSDEQKKLGNFIANGGGIPLEEILESILGEPVDTSLLSVVRLALDQAIIESRAINISQLLEQHLEWQEVQA